MFLVSASAFLLQIKLRRNSSADNAADAGAPPVNAYAGGMTPYNQYPGPNAPYPQGYGGQGYGQPPPAGYGAPVGMGMQGGPPPAAPRGVNPERA